jgi:hypothetical protein
MRFPTILDSNGRKAWAFLAVLGGCVVMTLFAAVAVYLVSGNAAYSFWLGLAAHAQIALGLGVFGAQFVRRTIKAGKDGIEIADAVDAVADAAADKAEELKP